MRRATQEDIRAFKLAAGYKFGSTAVALAFDIDIRNVVLYWHFALIMTLVTVATVAGFPLVA